MENQMEARQQGNGMAVSALVLGLVGLVLGLVPFLGWFMLPAWILAIVFGAVGLKKGQSKGMSWTGIVLGIITFIYKFGFWILVAIGASTST
ncbi:MULTISPECIES: hypothetical protein [Neobacillus]|uniref:DUF4190 domain-containing protein n=1 Tax=Neobacillus rhizophilus TaxID=2833579 RepID=A0A942YWH8_9BACI|nr:MULTISPECIES: hypothetical protein [Neobacillus]MBS4214992.1 hypothetical protein [Neobacillus rhizophilus]MBU8919144.1 hypothetical protein [Bacillus sp. FJAT-29953]